jgi:hypothetical protein
LSNGISDDLQTLIGVPPPHQPLHPLEARCLRIIVLDLIGVADAPEGAADFIAKVQKMKMTTSLMEWIMILARSSSGSRSIKDTATIKENGRK